MHHVKTLLLIALMTILVFLAGFSFGKHTTATTYQASTSIGQHNTIQTKSNFTQPSCGKVAVTVKSDVEPKPAIEAINPKQSTPWLTFAENFDPKQLKQQRRTAQAQLRLAAEQTQSSEQLLSIANKLKSLSDEPLDNPLANKLLEHAKQLNEQDQLMTLSLLQDALITEQLESLQEFFYSHHSEVREEAFLRLQELGVTKQTLPYFEMFTDSNFHPNWLTAKAKAMIYAANSGV